MSEEGNISDVFTTYQTHLDNDQEIREELRSAVKEVEQVARAVVTILQAVHQPQGLGNVATTCEAGRRKLGEARDHLARLATLVPADQYYRYHDHWRWVVQRLTFLVAFMTYLESGTLVTRHTVAASLGLCEERGAGFHLDLEDFLMGLLQVASELSRLAVNAVTAGDYKRPVQISKFVCELEAGFRLLNLKNDGLRKRFDALKYDVKKIEEVVYDVTIRGLVPKDGDADK